MQKRIFQMLFPLGFSFVSSFLYIFFYNPDFNSTEITTVFFIFFAALGWSGIIYFGESGAVKYSYIYSFISIIAPLIFFEFARLLPYDEEWHRVILLIIFAANLWLIDIYRGKKKKN